MRHGNRADDSEAPPEEQATVDKVEDTSLSKAGFETAEKVTLEHILSGVNFKNDFPKQIDMIYSSPLLRCVQTAEVARKILCLHDIVITHGICEVMDKKVIKKPVNEFKLRTSDEFKSEYKIEANLIHHKTNNINIIPYTIDKYKLDGGIDYRKYTKSENENGNDIALTINLKDSSLTVSVPYGETRGIGGTADARFRYMITTLAE
jgi:hypothetical protein